MAKATQQQKKPNKMSELYLLTQGFTPPVILYTHAGGKTIEVSHVHRYQIHPKTGAAIKKLDVMFAISKASLADVKSGITMDSSLKAQGLRTAEKIQDRVSAKIKDEQLDNGLQQSVRCVMLSGHVLRGRLVSVSRYILVLKIRNHLVVVYRHGLLEFSIEGASEK